MNNRKNPQISMMRTFFAPKTVPPQLGRQTTESTASLLQTTPPESLTEPNGTFSEQVMFWSDMSSSSDEFETLDEEQGSCDHLDLAVEARRLPQVPPRKRQKLEVSYRAQRQQQREQNINNLKKAHIDIEKLLASRKTKFVAGENGLQIRRTRAIECYLRLKIKNGRSTQKASECAAESQGFAPKWGGRQVRSWAKVWVKERELPRSQRGSHAKVSSLLDDPKVADELRM